MSLNSVLSIASSGLYAIQGQIAVVSQNVANANSPGYTEQVANSLAVANGGQSDGVRLGVAIRLTTPALQTAQLSQNSAVAEATVLNRSLQTITSAEGSTDASAGSTGSLTSSLSSLEQSLAGLQSDPISSVQQQQVSASAQTLTSEITNLASVYATQRQAASDAIVSEVSSANTSLSQIGSLSRQIAEMRTAGESTASLEDQRSAAMSNLSDQMNVRFVEQPNGMMLVMTTSGIMLPTDAQDGPLQYTSTTITPSDAYDKTGSPIPNITLDGRDITDSISGGSIGANISLRDAIIPGYTSQLDAFAATVAQRLGATGLPILTDASGSVPVAGSAPPVGFSSNIALASNASSLLAASTTNSVQNVLQFAFGDNSGPGTPWPPVSASQTLPYSATGQLADFAARLTSSQGADAQAAQTNLSDETAMQTSLTSQISAVTAVSIDSEMTKMTALQNSYEANAKVITAVQSMFGSLLAAVTL